MDELRRRAQSLLSSSGLAQSVKVEVQAMADCPLPLSEKFQHLTVENMLRENCVGSTKQEVWDSLSRLVKALSILEKYGCNLTSPARPKYWRSVKHNNPVFRATVDAIKGGRNVLYLYGYTNQQIDGLSFPDQVSAPDVEKVSAVTLEVMTLRTELDMIIKGIHPHLEHFRDVIPFVIQETSTVEKQQEVTVKATPPAPQPPAPQPPAPQPPAPQPHAPQSSAPQLPSPQPPAPLVSLELHQPPTAASSDSSPVGECNLCGRTTSVLCPSCDGKSFCDACDDLYHRHPCRADHKRSKIQTPNHETCSICGISSVEAQCFTCNQRLCLNYDRIFHSHPERTGHNRTTVMPAKTSSLSLSPWKCAHCTTVNELGAILCTTCERPRLATAVSAARDEPASVTSPSSTEWQCKSCTVVNPGSSILCEVCERPRLATRPPVSPAMSSPASLSEPGAKWICHYCTFVNTRPSTQCQICDQSCKDPVGASLPVNLLPEKPRPKPKPRMDRNLKRQGTMREDGRHLIQQIREAEKRSVSAEEVYAALCMCGGSNVNPCDWLASELPHVLDEICAMAASVLLSHKTGNAGNADPQSNGDGTEQSEADVKLSRAEAKLAWLAAGGDTNRAVKRLMRDRHTKMTELHSLGFRDVAQCEEALRQSGGEMKGALSLLQRPLMEPFHQRIWSGQVEPPIDPKHPDKQRMCRRLLALYDLPSWGRCELVLSLLQEPDVSYCLEDVVQAVKESHDRDFIKRLLVNECPCCLGDFPRSKMQSLTSCQCYVCHECFGQHFTVAVRDKHIREMVCPVCSEPDINDPEQLDSYFSTLDIQLRNCLDVDVYDLFHKKLTEHTLMNDPKFLWCCHCISGFINDGDQLKVTCPSCKKSFCTQCKKPWEPQHQDVSCEQFQQWKRDNDPEYQRQGLAGFLRDNGITCPQCRFQYALSKGGCMHFTCSQCRFQFCSGCNNPFHKTLCKTPQCTLNCLHAHHPRDCLFYLRDWEPPRLQELLTKCGVDFNTDPFNDAPNNVCCVMEQKDEGGQQTDLPCGVQTQPGQAGLCEKHYREYLVSLINVHSLDPALIYDADELIRNCERYQVPTQRRDAEDDVTFYGRLQKNLMEVPLGEKVPRKKET